MKPIFLLLVALLTGCSAKTNTLRYDSQLRAFENSIRLRADAEAARADSLAKQIAACTTDGCREHIAALDAVARAAGGNQNVAVPQPHYERDAGAQFASALTPVVPMVGAAAQAYQGVKQAEYNRDQYIAGRFYDSQELLGVTGSLERVGIAAVTTPSVVNNVGGNFGDTQTIGGNLGDTQTIGGDLIGRDRTETNIGRDVITGNDNNNEGTIRHNSDDTTTVTTTTTTTANTDGRDCTLTTGTGCN